MKTKAIDTSNVNLIPHGNYIDIYTEKISKNASRELLCVSKDEFVVLFFGAVRRGKGIESLIKNFTSLPQKKTRLIVAGRCKDTYLIHVIKKASEHINIDFINEYIPEKEVTKYVKACDVFCVPFSENTTSGSVILAMSLKRTVIAPRLGSLIDMPIDVGYFYDPNDPNGLLNSLKIAIRRKSVNTTKSKKAFNYILSQNWDSIAIKTYNLYKNQGIR